MTTESRAPDVRVSAAVGKASFAYPPGEREPERFTHLRRFKYPKRMLYSSRIRFFSMLEVSQARSSCRMYRRIQNAMKLQATKKSAETKERILEAALKTFRERGFAQATMREIAVEAGVASGAAYYYFDSKDAIVMAFYERAQGEMHATIEQALSASSTLEQTLKAIIETKLTYFAPNRKLLGTLSAHIDPEHPLSPFSVSTAPIRNQDVEHFRRAVAESKVSLPANLEPYLPRLLWMYQMGLILFWVYDRSPAQRKTHLLFQQTLKMLLLAIKIAGLPFLRPMHRLAGDLLNSLFEPDTVEGPRREASHE